jgi:hypothetical protein
LDVLVAAGLDDLAQAWGAQDDGNPMLDDTESRERDEFIGIRLLSSMK